MSDIYTETGRKINEQTEKLSEKIVEEQWRRNPELQETYGEEGKIKCINDVKYNLHYLSESVITNSTVTFTNYIDWLKVLFSGLGIPEEDLAENLVITGEILISELPDISQPVIEKFIQAGIDEVNRSSKTVQSFFDESKPLTPVAKQYLEYLLQGKRNDASKLILDTAENGTSVKDIYLQIFQPGQQEIGRLWQMNKITVAQEHYSTAATQLIMSQLYPKIFSTEKNGRKMIALCAGKELHEIGIRMVADFFEMEGWDTYYLGANTPTETLLQTLEEKQIDILAISATMTFHVELVRELIKKVRNNDSLPTPKIMVGGYPFNVDNDLWKQLGADAYALNAQEAIERAQLLISHE